MVVDLPKTVSMDDNMNLVKPVENQEIKKAVFQMDKFKAPGPDGFGAAFSRIIGTSYKMQLSGNWVFFFRTGNF